MTTTAPPDQLPCLRLVDDLIDQVAQGRAEVFDEHQQQCPHCRAFLTETTVLWAPVAAYAAERLTPPRYLVHEVMTTVRELAAQVWHVVLPGDRGVTRIAARVVGTIARTSAAQVRGVRVVLGRSTQARLVSAAEDATQDHRARGSAVGVAGQRAVVDLAMMTSYGDPIPEVAAAVRGRVLAELRHLADLRDVEVNITVDDVLEDRPVAAAAD